jgi:hypothetical protein
MQEPEISNQYSSPGERLTHLLDNIMFESGRGRTRALYNLLIESSIEDFSDLKFGTVRSWFHNHAPTMRKVTTIVELLSATYVFEQDKEQVAVWWKVGGYYPYDTVEPSLNKNHIEELVSSIIQKSAQDSGLMVSESAYQRIRDLVLEMCREFADPSISECPNKYIEMLIRDQLRNTN